MAVGLGEEAIARVRDERFGAVVLDMGLPDLHGLAVLKVLMELDPPYCDVIVQRWCQFTGKEAVCYDKVGMQVDRKIATTSE